MNTSVASVMKGAQKLEIRRGLRPCRQRSIAGDIGVVLHEGRQIDLVQQRELNDPMVQFEAALTVGGELGTALRNLALRRCDVRSAVRFKKFVMRVILARFVRRKMDAVAMTDGLIVRWRFGHAAGSRSRIASVSR